MQEEHKVAVVPEPAKVETAEPVNESLIDNRRTEIEKLVIKENETIPPPEPDLDEPPAETKLEEQKEEVKEEVKPNDDPIDRIKKSVQKRIDKVVAQKKSAEEELAEARAEIERLRAPKPEPSPFANKDETPPTPEQVEAYIVKMREEGNVKEEIAATRYLIKLEKEMALKTVKEEQEQAAKQAEQQRVKQLTDWANLSRDYTVYDKSGKPDNKHELSLANQNGLLYKTALGLYNDKDLHADFYNDPDVIQGFRRAVADAYREIHQQGLITPKGTDTITDTRRNTRILAEPSADFSEDSSPSNNSNSLTDAEKVREEIRMRNKNRYIRR